jgi:hypothetical protein
MGNGDARYIGREEAKSWLNANIGSARDEVAAHLSQAKASLPGEASSSRA